MKKILLSLALMVLAGSAAITATRAYFTDTKVLGSNTISTGTVKLGDTWHLPFSLTGLAPGQESVTPVLGAQYIGTLPADIYVGMRAVSGKDFTTVLDYYIEKVDNAGNHISNVTGWRSITFIFSEWNQVATNVSLNQWNYYKVHIRMHSDADNTFQDETATDDIIIYAVQTGTPAPSGQPWNSTI
ncbi:TPA: hypothetical protein DD455_03605 [Candidatus Shapirobacteria bacterium]|nr:hypothetical protein [Candidatus Shapirobacteria bacterium]